MTCTALSSISSKIDITSESISSKIDITAVLNDGIDGEYILQYYVSNNILNDGLRAMLVDLIVNHMIKMNIKMTVKVAETISDGIVNVFPTESKVSLSIPKLVTE